jgi:hypothetical protein
MSRQWIRRLTLTATVAIAATALPATAQAAPYCGLAWGSLPEVSTGADDTDMVVDVRSGRHACYDRLVVDLLGQDTTFSSYNVRYVPVVREDGSGHAVPVRGAADLQVTLKAPAYDGDGNATFDPANPREVVAVGGYSTFRQVASAGSYEGYTTLALGVRARLPFRVFTLPGVAGSDFGPRLVIDVAHRW